MVRRFILSLAVVLIVFLLYHQHRTYQEASAQRSLERLGVLAHAVADLLIRADESGDWAARQLLISYKFEREVERARNSRYDPAATATGTTFNNLKVELISRGAKGEVLAPEHRAHIISELQALGDAIQFAVVSEGSPQANAFERIREVSFRLADWLNAL